MAPSRTDDGPGTRHRLFHFEDPFRRHRVELTDRDQRGDIDRFQIFRSIPILNVAIDEELVVAVHGVIDLCCDIGLQSISKRTLKSNLRKIERVNFRYSLTKDPVDFHFFYYNMHLPYISKRHGDSAFKISYEKMKKSFENGELLQIKEGQEIVAAVIIDYKVMNGIPRTTKLGVLRGDFNYVKRGAIIALYYYTIQYLKEGNHKKISFGLTRPFFSDGVLQYKLNWGAKIVCETSNGFLLSLLSKKKCLKSFLSCNPFIFKDRNSLTLATFSDHNSKECSYLPKDENKLKLYGLDKITSYSL